MVYILSSNSTDSDVNRHPLPFQRSNYTHLRELLEYFSVSLQNPTNWQPPAHLEFSGVPAVQSKPVYKMWVPYFSHHSKFSFCKFRRSEKQNNQIIEKIAAIKKYTASVKLCKSQQKF
ncbi:hypothetical protein HELRODRAFT_161081 [Helobdella robusta]|uniref:Uncharacterized protein n=1 Tax=Helobdella robusta TaxID=6412 RepID=T1ER30_HELRO|nr:hypothetical protein HELRODRAFT_161081 [Helobdella robusta]ESO01891.1 hypothetical protein HELRODRAFT_161081 [Helobdella robusta]